MNEENLQICYFDDRNRSNKYEENEIRKMYVLSIFLSFHIEIFNNMFSFFIEIYNNMFSFLIEIYDNTLMLFRHFFANRHIHSNEKISYSRHTWQSFRQIHSNVFSWCLWWFIHAKEICWSNYRLIFKTHHNVHCSISKKIQNRCKRWFRHDF